ncbi:hypothetical protein SAMN05216252_117131 [Actinacidiphila glaucinigra]|uniref:Uncharacterized protein n=2 Tax=Actinacidiphila glaucinigra TaxID=235986 RepID=A0A239KZI5_9ACTN|nr:hypothetical protein SAMN05216252_117131 [Actinacidiphila glaucinigra]
MTWRLMRGDTVIGNLADDGCDMPFFLLRFTPEPGWEAVRPRFEALAAAVGCTDPDGRRLVAAVKALQDLELTLEDVEGREASLRVWRNCFLHIWGTDARLRY